MPRLTHKDLIIKTNGIYNNYMTITAKEEGICLGATLFWATEQLRYASQLLKKPDSALALAHKLKMQNVFLKKNEGLNQAFSQLANPQRVKIQHKFLKSANKAVSDDFPMENVRQFYDFSFWVHKSIQTYKNTELGIIGRKNEIIQALNAQEDYLSKLKKYNSTSENKIRYSLYDDIYARGAINGMINERKTYENTALLLSTQALMAETESKMYTHSSVFMNYEQQLYFFDVNKGVYAIPNDLSFTFEDLLLTLATSFHLKEAYQIIPLPTHIFIQTDIPRPNMFGGNYHYHNAPVIKLETP